MVRQTGAERQNEVILWRLLVSGSCVTGIASNHLYSAAVSQLHSNNSKAVIIESFSPN